jgi:hypothetical protein
MSILGLALLLTAGASRTAGAAWQVNERGECAQVWTPASLGRGPTAIASAMTLPFRSIAGGVQRAPDLWKSAPVPIGVLTVPGMIGVAFVGGVGETLVWVVSGVADTVTGGFFEIAPDAATELSVSPEPPFFMPGPKTLVTQDRCGRPITP